jgi:DNA replication protein DnaD
MSTFSFLKPANGLWKDAKMAKVKVRILERITDIPHEARNNKHSAELLLLICNMIEHSVDNKGKKEKLKIDKKCLLIDIFKSLFGELSPADCEMLSKNIEFLHDNNHIHREPLWKVCAYGLVDLLKRKFLN